MPLATEAIARASTVMFNNHRRDPDFVQFDVDVTNAFNEVHRSHFLEQVRQRIPGLARFAYACYAQASFLLYGDFVLRSSQGTQQGDPLGGLFFALGLHPIITRVDQQSKLNLHVWYFDDGRLDGPVAQVTKAFGILSSDLPSIGLNLKLAKCKLAFSEVYEARRGEEALDALDIDDIDLPPDSFPPEMERVMTRDKEPSKMGFVTMGYPVGKKEFIDEFFTEKLQRIKTLHTRISNLRRLQSQLWILRNCASVCKIMYWMRITDPEVIMPHLKAFDKMQFEVLQGIAGVDFDDIDSLLAILPLSNGGLVGMRSAEYHASAAYLAGSKNSESLVKSLLRGEVLSYILVESTLALYNSRVGPKARLDVAKLGAMESIEQKSLSIAIDNNTESRLISLVKNESDPEVRNLNLDRLLSIKKDSSKAWLLAIPNPNLGLGMSNVELRFALQLRLGHVVGNFRCSGERDHTVDRSGLEVLKCKKLQKVRHDVIASVVTNIARSAGEHPTRENLGLFGDGSKRRPGDIVLPNFNRGERLVMDVRVTNNKQDIFTRYVPNKAGRAADHGAQIKNSKWKKHCDEAFELTRVRVESKFTPLSTDVYGCWNEDALQVFYELAKKRRDFTDRDPDLEYKYVMQQISMALQRENAKILAAHLVHNVSVESEDEEDEVVVLREEVAIPEA